MKYAIYQMSSLQYGMPFFNELSYQDNLSYLLVIQKKNGILAVDAWKSH